VVAWGSNQFGQCNVPALPPGLTYVEVAAGGWHTVDEMRGPVSRAVRTTAATR